MPEARSWLAIVLSRSSSKCRHYVYVHSKTRSLKKALSAKTTIQLLYNRTRLLVVPPFLHLRSKATVAPGNYQHFCCRHPQISASKKLSLRALLAAPSSSWPDSVLVWRRKNETNQRANFS